jgi:hypothetical protein
MEIEKKPETEHEHQALQYIKEQLSTIKNVPANYVCAENEIVIKEFQAKNDKGESIKALKVQVLPSQKELKQMGYICEIKNISLKDLVLGNYYFLPINGKTLLFTKYTTIIRDFKRHYPTAILEPMEINGNMLSYHIIIDGREYKTILDLSQIKKPTGLSVIEYGYKLAVKTILRNNFPEFVETYDEMDLSIIKGDVEKVEPSKLLADVQAIKVGGDK